MRDNAVQPEGFWEEESTLCDELVPLPHVVQGRARPDVLVILSILPAEDAHVARIGFDRFDTVLSPVAAGCKCQQVSATIFTGALLASGFPELSCEAPVDPLFRGEAWPSCVKFFCDSCDCCLDNDAAVQVQGGVDEGYASEGSPNLRFSVNGQACDPKRLE